MPQRLVDMVVAMRLLTPPCEIVPVPVVLVMDVLVLVGDRLVRVLVLVVLGQVKVDAHGHQGRRDPERGRWLLPEQ